MTIDMQSSGVNVSEEAPQVIVIEQVPSAVWGLVGVTERGPIAQEVICNGPDDFERVFGSYIAAGDSLNVVNGFFANGGTELHFVRTNHFTDPTDPTTATAHAGTLTLSTAASSAGPAIVSGTNAAPWTLAHASTLVIVYDGGAPATVTFEGAPATATSAAGPYALNNGDTLELQVDGYSAPQTITFATSEFVSIGAALATEVAAVINAQLIAGNATVNGGGEIVIASDTMGTASRLNVIGGTAAAELTLATGITDGTGNVANLAAVQATEVEALVAAVAGGDYTAVYTSALSLETTTNGSGVTLQVTGASTAAGEFGFDAAVHHGTASAVAETLLLTATPGSYSATVTENVSAPTNGLAGWFNLQILDNGIVQETWPNLNMTVGDPRYAPTVLNDPNTGSTWVTATDLGAVGNRTPAFGTFGPMTGGTDGLAGLSDSDYTGGSGPNGQTGLRCLDAVADLSLVSLPERPTAAAANGIVTYVEIYRAGYAFGVIDPPPDLSAEEMIDYIQNTAALTGISERVATYWPNILISNPDPTVYGTPATILCPPSGHIIGLYAKVDGSQPFGVFVPPAGSDNPLQGVAGVENTSVLKRTTRDLIFPALINPISREPGTSWFLDGARCLKSDGNWPTIGQRRGIINTEASLQQGLVGLRHKNINDRLLEEGAAAADLYMLGPTNAGVLYSTDPSKAFKVDFGPGLNNAATNQARTVWGRVGIATSLPAEFVNLLIAPDNDDLEALLAALATQNT